MPTATKQSTSHNITVTLENGERVVCPPHSTIKALIDGEQSSEGLHYLGGLVNNEVVSLSYPLEVDCHVKFLTLADPHGWRIYRRSASFLLAKAVKELFPKAFFSVEHSLGTGFYCNFDDNGDTGIQPAQVESIEKLMRQWVEKDIRIERRKISFEAAVNQFEKEGQKDKYDLLRFRNPPKVVIYYCDGFSDLAYGPMAYSTGALSMFKLIPYETGFVIQFAERENPTHLPEFERQPHLFEIFKEHKEWGRILGVRTVGDLNRIISDKEIDEFIKIEEALHEKKLAQIADQIAGRRDRIKWLLIAGPSSAGKTTFSKRLGVQLKVNGFRPVTISMDDYFVDRDRTPRDEDGEFDFENVETIDLELLNEHLEKLDRGEAVEIPRFNFEKGSREYRGDILEIGDDQLVIMEGIHCLNPRLTAHLPAERKFKIYLSALTQLSLDFNNRISTTDNRLIRRMVRDNQFRGNPALNTLKRWPSVRRGEKKWIFPFQQESDIAFNSSLDYELAVLRPFAEPLLNEVKPYHPQYAEARGLLEFLGSFNGIPYELVPTNSILREFVGKSSFRY